MNLWAFWEPEDAMPAYLKLCIETWKQIPNAKIHLLNYKNLREYIDIDAYGANLFSGAFQMAQIADAIRVMLLEKYSGAWLDVDSIILNEQAGELLSGKEKKDVTLFGNKTKNHCHMGLLVAHRAGTVMMINFVAFNKNRIWNLNKYVQNKIAPWGYLSGNFLEPYAYGHPEEVEILDWSYVHPAEQLLRVKNGLDYKKVYEDYFFIENHQLKEINESIVILNNSWTPQIYKRFSYEELLKVDCTTTNLLAEILDIKRPAQRIKFKRV